jgi:hypothetical protein
MIAFPGMLIDPAKKAGMKVPEDVKSIDDFDPNEYPHFNIFCLAQLGQPMPNWSAHWDNARVVAALTEEECKTITFEQLYEKGFAVGYSK